MYSITINGNQTLKTNLNTSNKEFEGTLNDAIVKGNFEKINPYQYHFLMLFLLLYFPVLIQHHFELILVFHRLIYL
jgi:hypothetical protein